MKGVLLLVAACGPGPTGASGPAPPDLSVEAVLEPGAAGPRLSVTVAAPAAAAWTLDEPVSEPLAFTEAVLKEYALGGPMCGLPRRLKRMRSIALASVAVPTVERGSAPMRCWSTLITVVRPSRTSTSGRARFGMKPWTKAG